VGAVTAIRLAFSWWEDASVIATVSTHTAADGRTSSRHGTTVMLPDGRRQPLSWFACRATAGATRAALPTGSRVTASPVTRRPYLRRV